MKTAWSDSLRLAARQPAVRRMTLVCALSAVLATITLAVYWLPAHRAYSRLEMTVQQKRQDIIGATREAAVARIYGTTEKQVDGMERKLNVANSQTALIHGLASLANKYDVAIKSETYEEGKAQDDGFIPLYCEINLQGAYPAVRRFLFGLPTLTTLTWIQEASLASNEGHGEIKVRLRLVTYRRAAATGAGRA